MNDFFIGDPPPSYCSACGVQLLPGAGCLKCPTVPVFKFTFPPADLAVAVKKDDGKNRLELLDPAWLEEVGKVLTFGAKKYEDHNWRKGFAWSRLFGAALRHIFAFVRGEDKDPETGLSHLAHASCCLMFLTNHYLTGIGTDDRWKAKP